MPQYWKIVNEVIHDADVLLLLLDARLVMETRHWEVEKKVRRENKPLIYVVTKSDLVGKDAAEKWKYMVRPSVFVSAKKRLGTTKLRDKILTEAQKAGNKTKIVKVGVLGYPNVGKSSLINALKGRHVARTSVESGQTKGVQKVKADSRIVLLDTPGVIPFNENDDMKHAVIGTIDFNKAKEPDMVVFKLMKNYPGRIERFYEMPPNEDFEETIEHIAVKKNVLKRGGKPDTDRMARLILKDWQKGEID